MNETDIGTVKRLISALQRSVPPIIDQDSRAVYAAALSRIVEAAEVYSELDKFAKQFGAPDWVTRATNQK